MTLTLLLDLDDTLLSNDIQVFLPAYLQALSKYLSKFVDPSRLVDQLLAATKEMVENNQPDRTLEDVFDASFYPAIGISKAKIQDKIEDFYKTVFPTLQPLTSPRKEAVQLVDMAKKHGWQIVIATNPIFPRSAILERLKWADLPTAKYHFDLIPSYEEFHFAKPNPAFFSELLSHLGCPSGPTLMVGNDYFLDIAPAKQIGLPTYLVSPENIQKETGANEDHEWQGPLDDLVSSLGQPRTIKNKAEPLTPEALFSSLRATPAALSSLIKSIPPQNMNRRPTASDWSFTEILCHMRDVDREVNLPRLEKILVEENPFLPGVDSDPWAEVRQYNSQDGFQALGAFIDARKRIISLLEKLPPDGWNRTARHAIFGPTKLIELIGFIVTHDQNHLGQWRQVVEKLDA